MDRSNLAGMFVILGALTGGALGRCEYYSKCGDLKMVIRWAFVGLLCGIAVVALALTGCASNPPSPTALDWQTNYRLVRIVYVGSPVDFATQHLCPVGDAVYTVFEDVVDHSRLWRCSPPRGHIGDVVSLYE